MKRLTLPNLNSIPKKVLLLNIFLVLSGGLIGSLATAYFFIKSISFAVEMRVLKSAVEERNSSSVIFLYGITRNNIVKEVSVPNHGEVFFKQRSQYKDVKNGEEFFQVTRQIVLDNQESLQTLKNMGFNENEVKSLFYMNLVSGFWDYGNKNHPDKVGCVGSNEDNNWQRISGEKITIQDYLQSNIGCCTDYAHFLKYLLDRENIKNRLVLIPGHIFNEVWLNNNWRVLDANTGLYINKSWQQLLENGGKYNDLLIYRFPRHDASVGERYRQIIPAFQLFMLQKALVGGTDKELQQVEYPELPEWFARF